MGRSIFDFTLEKLTDELVGRGQSKYRSKQLFSWLYQKRVLDFNAMSDVSKSFREELVRDFKISLPKIHTRQDSSDGTIKLLLEMDDGAKVETVLMRYNYGNALCVSSQVGCLMGCAFCASGLLSKQRNLTTDEMVGEVMVMNEILAQEGSNVTHIDVMGTGEPFDNYDNVIDFVRIANCQFGLNISARKITVSTCGLVPGIRKYAEEGMPINLALSLHAPNDEIRNQIMPVSKAYKINDVMDAVAYYNEKTTRRATFEYIMLKGLNDSRECAHELAQLIHEHHIFCYVNLIPYNEVAEKPYKRTDRNTCREFATILMNRGINCTIRKEFGSDIDAACGQLRAKAMKGER